MQITPVFNDAAQGGDGPTEAVVGPEGHGPAGGAAQELSAESSEATTYPDEPLLNVFSNRVTKPETSDEQTQAEPEQQKREFSVARAKADMEMLEDGRPAPEPRAELKPPPNIVRIVDRETERKREARISALRAYLEFHQDELECGTRHDLGDDIQLAL